MAMANDTGTKTPSTEKTCTTCGKAVHGRRYHVNRKGELLCRPCHEASPKVCLWCNAEVARRDCHRTRHGDYICRKCRDRRETKKWFKIGWDELRRYAIYTAVALVALAVFWKMLGWVAYD
jgi:hypothetical protein